jgi:hypothetical protein
MGRLVQSPAVAGIDRQCAAGGIGAGIPSAKRVGTGSLTQTPEPPENPGRFSFKDRALQPFCLNKGDGKTVASTVPSLLGTHARTLNDKTGKLFGEEICKAGVYDKIEQPCHHFNWIDAWQNDACEPHTTNPQALRIRAAQRTG